MAIAKVGSHVHLITDHAMEGVHQVSKQLLYVTLFVKTVDMVRPVKVIAVHSV